MCSKCPLVRRGKKGKGEHRDDYEKGRVIVKYSLPPFSSRGAEAQGKGEEKRKRRRSSKSELFLDPSFARVPGKKSRWK